MFDFSLEPPEASLLDLSPANSELANLNLADNQSFGSYIFNGNVRLGGYLEKRAMYQKSELFGGGEARDIHLGVDVWAIEGSPIYAPMQGVIWGVGNNASFGNYGPTVIVKHTWQGGYIFALYGHLGINVLDKWKVGDELQAGTLLAHFGEEEINGNWPPHLHFQLIREVEQGAFDFPGVCAESELEKFKSICPNPNAILQSSLLTTSNYP